MPNNTCLNCNASLNDSARFCAHCGQRAIDIRRPWLDVLRELLDELFDLNGKMLRSARMLFTRPGLLAREYSAGRRAGYTSPVRMYLVISVVFFFVLPLIQSATTGQPAERAVSTDQYSRAMFVLLPVFAGLLKLLYRQTYYLNHLVFSAYLFSFFFVLMAAMMATEAAADQYLPFAIAQTALLCWGLAYLAIALRVGFEQSWAKTIFKTAALVIAFMPMLASSIVLSARLSSS